MANIGDLGSSFVATAPSPATSGTSLVVTSGTGANFPAAPFYATLTPPGSLATFGTSEIVLVTAKSTDTFTIVRAQKSTTAKTVVAGWIITNAIYKDDLLSTITFGEVPTGLVNSSNTVYTTANPFTSIEVFKNGVRMKGGGADYTVTNNTTVTMTSAPTTGAVLLVNYIMGNQLMVVGSNSRISDETPTGSVNGSNSTFTTAQSYIPGSLQLFINGVKQKRVTHFTETSPGTGQFTISDAPLTGDDIMVNYNFVSSTTGNADTVDGIHANTTPTANTLVPLDSAGKIPLLLKENPWMRASHTGRPSMSLSSFSLAIVDFNTSFDGGGGSSYLTFNASTDRITIGSGVSKVKISAQVGSLSGPVTSELDLNIQKNGVTLLTAYGAKRATNDLITFTIPPKTISVAPGDYFQIGVVAQTAGTYSFIFDNDLAGWMEIEVVG